MANHDPDEANSKWIGKSCYWRDPGPGAAEADRCPDCGGSGNIVLLVTAQPCERCGGTGVLKFSDPVVSYEYHGAFAAAEEAARERIELRPAAEWGPPILSTYIYENDILVSEKRLLCKNGQWWGEQFVMADGDLQVVSRAPTAPSPGLWPKQ